MRLAPEILLENPILSALLLQIAGRVLEQNHGNVNRCIDLLLSQPMPAAPAPAAPAPPAETANSDASGSADNDEAEKNEESKKND